MTYSMGDLAWRRKGILFYFLLLLCWIGGHSVVSFVPIPPKYGGKATIQVGHHISRFRANGQGVIVRRDRVEPEGNAGFRESVEGDGLPCGSTEVSGVQQSSPDLRTPDFSKYLAEAEALWKRQLESPQQFANLIILVIAGLYGLSLLLTVDMDVWRGWTWQEIIVRLPYDNWQEYEGGLTQHPVVTKTLINVVIYLIGDWMSQVNWGRDKSVLDFDLARTARNGLIGAFFGPLVHYYYDFSDWILPMDVPINRVLKILMDQSIYFISKCSVYIALVGLLRGDGVQQVRSDVQERIWPVVFRGWRFWPLAHIVTYGVIPPRHRVLWVNMLDLLWSSILAGLTSKDATPAVAITTEELRTEDLEKERQMVKSMPTCELEKDNLRSPSSCGKELVDTTAAGAGRDQKV